MGDGGVNSPTFAEATNKIVNFSRPNVSPIPSNITNIVSNISINIQEQVQNVLDNTLKSFSQDYQQKIKGFDDKRPNNVLSKFLELYQNAIGFVNFFGNRKNIETVEKNLKAIRVLFNESFEVAKVLRQTIIKIVKQLTNLPTASPNSGGLNLDIDVPGGRLKQAGGPKIRNIGRGAGLGAAAGIGLLGIGGLATAASGMGRAKQYQEEMLASGVQAAPMEQTIPEGFIDTFSSIVDRFTSAIDGLLKGAKSTPGSSGGRGGGGLSAAPSAGPGANDGVTITDDTQALKELGFTQEQFNALKQGVADVEGAKYNQMGGVGARFAGRYQMGSAEISASAKVMGIPVPSQEEYLNNPELQEKIYMGRTIYMHRRLQELSPKYNNMSPKERAIALGMGQLGEGNVSSYINTGNVPRDSAGVPITKWGTAVGKRFDAASSIPPKSQPTQQTTQVSPAPTQTQMTQLRAQAISQPAQQVPQTISLPPTVIDATSQQQDSGGGGVVSPPPPSGGTIDIPMLPTGNPDNFLTMYSRIVYNIVDG